MKRLVAFLLVTGLVVPCAVGLTAEDTKATPEMLLDVPVEMAVSARDLGKFQTGKPTQARQKKIVLVLDKVIAELEKECEKCKGGGASSNNPNKPLNDSMIVGGTGGIGDLHAPKQAGKKWGELPAKERDRILQSMSEGFPPHYRPVLEQYYKKLAEETTIKAEKSKVSK